VRQRVKGVEGRVKWTPFLGPWRERTTTKKTRRRIDAGLKAKVALECPAGKGDGKRQMQEQAARPSDAGVGGRGNGA
jgi:hypothetical protein